MSIATFGNQYIVDTRDQVVPREVKHIFFEQRGKELNDDRILVLPRLSR